MTGPQLPARLHAPLTKGVTSVAHVPEAWYVACMSSELKKAKVLARTILGIPCVVFRTRDGAVGALLDRCPHRNVPLSMGEVVQDSLRCPYHGWRFAPDGACLEVPCLDGAAESQGRRADAFPVTEQDGFVWIYAVPGAEPTTRPYTIPCANDRSYTTVRQVVEAEASLHAVAENALDVPHTAFLHKGLFRGGRKEPVRIEVVVRNWGDRVEAQYIGEPRPPGLAGKIVAPGKDTKVEHYDRFFLPCVAQVEYRMGNSHFIVTSCMTPLEDFRTRLFATISFKVPLPGFLVALILAPVAKMIFHQDAVLLARQTANLRLFGGEQYTSTDVDALGQHILQLLKQAERGTATPTDEPQEKRFDMLVP
jgi:nitrite reductase/ring-hydroxylating ferredoxin subunit